jgi:hypothetical protein
MRNYLLVLLLFVAAAGVAQPTVTSFTPTSAATGTPITITGTSLSGAFSVTLGGTAVSSFSVLSSTTIRAIVGNGSSGSVTVTTDSGQAVLGGFNFVSTSPVLKSFTPTAAAKGETITVTGAGLSGTLTVTLGGTPVTSFKVISGDLLTLVVGEGLSGSLNVTTAGGSAALTGFQFLLPVVPNIISFDPKSARSGDTVIITGNNFTGTSSVRFGPTEAASFAELSSTTIKAIVGAGSSGEVSVTAAGGTNSKAGFVYTPIEIPVLTGFVPFTGTTGDTITIHGTNLTTLSAISFGGTAAASFSIISFTKAKAVLGNGSSGAVVISTASGGTASQTGFIYIPENPESAAVTSFTPVAAGEGATLTVTGRGLTGILSVTLGGTAVASFKSISSTLLTLVTGKGASGPLNITLATGLPIGRSGFTFVKPVIIADTTLCKTRNVKLTTNLFTDSAGITTQWYLNNALIPGATAASYIATSAGSYRAVVTAGGAGYPSNDLVVVLNPQPVASFVVVTDSVQCLQNNRFTFSGGGTVAGGSIASKKWIFGDSSNATSTLNDPGFSYKEAGNYRVKLVVLSNKGCTDTIEHSVKVLAAPKLVITNPAPVCGVNPVDITAVSIVAGSQGGVNYSYWKDSTATNALTNASAVSVSGTYYIKTSETGGCGNIKPVVVKINPLPLLAAITGDASVCMGATTVLRNTTAGGFWSSTNTGVLTIDTTGKVTPVSPGTATVVYTYTNSQTTCSNTATTNITVLALPFAGKAEISGHTSDTTECFTTSITLTSKNTYDKYLWSNGAVTSSIQVTANAAVTLKAGNAQTGCYSLPSVVINARKNNTPVPTISRSGDSLLSSNSFAYKWYFNNKITGDTTQRMAVGARGFYNVTTSLDRICWSSSNDYILLLDPVVKKSYTLSTYPNPSNGVFSIQVKFDRSTSAIVNLTLVDQSGVTKWTAKKLLFFDRSMKIPVNLNIAKGTYTLRVDVNGEINTQQIVVL